MLVTALVIIGAIALTVAIAWPLIAHYLSGGALGRWWW